MCGRLACRNPKTLPITHTRLNVFLVSQCNLFDQVFARPCETGGGGSGRCLIIRRVHDLLRLLNGLQFIEAKTCGNFFYAILALSKLIAEQKFIEPRVT